MGVSFGRSRVADLSFQLFGRSLHPDWFATRAHKRVGGDGWEADVRIIEGGHTVTWRSGATRLTEVLVGPLADLPESGLLYHSPVRRDRAAELSLERGPHYHACLDVERLDAEVFAHLSEEMTLDASRGDLFIRFAVADRMAPPSLSRVHIEARGRGVSIQAFHTFPAERAIVRTLSLLELERP
jgi:hypothetical protein